MSKKCEHGVDDFLACSDCLSDDLKRIDDSLPISHVVSLNQIMLDARAQATSCGNGFLARMWMNLSDSAEIIKMIQVKRELLESYNKNIQDDAASGD